MNEIPRLAVFIQIITERRKNMAKSCKPTPKVSKAGKTLSTSKSSSSKTKAAKTLVTHKTAKH